MREGACLHPSLVAPSGRVALNQHPGQSDGMECTEVCTEQQHFMCEDGMECTDVCTTGRPGLCYNGAECTERWLIEQQWLCNNDIKYAKAVSKGGHGCAALVRNALTMEQQCHMSVALYGIQITGHDGSRLELYNVKK